MFLLWAIFFSLAVAVIRRKDIKVLGRAEFTLPWLVVAAFLIQLVIFSPLVNQLLLSVKWAIPVMHLLSYLLLILFISLNLKYKSLWIIGAGMLSNLIVIASNRGYMPAKSECLEAANRAIEEGKTLYNSILLNENTRFPFLADIFHTPGNFPFANVFSIGDVLIAIGAFFLIQELLKAKNK